MDRRDFLSLTAVGGGAVFASSLAGCARPEGAAAVDKDFYFVQLSDVHWGYQGPANPDSAVTLRKAVAAINALPVQPEFIVFTGDLTHTTDDPAERRRRMAEFKTIVADLRVRNVRFMPGEHDASLDRGEAFKEFFGDTHYAFDHKGAHFIALCDAYGLPIVSFIDVPGFSIGSSAERTNLGRRSAKLIFEWGHATVPRVSIVVRKGYGLGYFAMCGGRSFSADACFAWPSAEICAMSIEGAIDVAFRKEYLNAPDPMKRRQEMIDETRTRIGALRGAEGFGIDDIIDPRDTRRRLVEIFASTLPRRPQDHPPKYRSIAPI